MQEYNLNCTDNGHCTQSLYNIDNKYTITKLQFKYTEEKVNALQNTISALN